MVDNIDISLNVPIYFYRPSGIELGLSKDFTTNNTIITIDFPKFDAYYQGIFSNKDIKDLTNEFMDMPSFLRFIISYAYSMDDDARIELGAGYLRLYYTVNFLLFYLILCLGRIQREIYKAIRDFPVRKIEGNY